MPMHVGQTALDSVVIEGELLAIQAQQVQNRGVEVVDRDRVSRQLLTEIDQGPVTGASIAAAPWQSARRVQLRTVDCVLPGGAQTGNNCDGAVQRHRRLLDQSQDSQ